MYFVWINRCGCFNKNKHFFEIKKRINVVAYHLKSTFSFFNHFELIIYIFEPIILNYKKAKNSTPSVFQTKQYTFSNFYLLSPYMVKQEKEQESGKNEVLARIEQLGFAVSPKAEWGESVYALNDEILIDLEYTPQYPPSGIPVSA